MRECARTTLWPSGPQRSHVAAAPGATEFWHAAAMFRSLLGCLVLTGCLKANPAWEAGSGDTSTSAGPPIGSSGGSTGAAPTTGAATSTATGTGTGDGSTISTSSQAATTGEGSSTGAPAAVCVAFETVPLALPVEDTGVVQKVGPEPCPWSTDFEKCSPLNFGTTQFYRLINDENDGRNAALLRFPVTSLDDAVIASGHDPGDVLGLRVELVIWEELPAPVEPYTFEIHGLDAQNFGWTEGTKDALVAVDGDSSDECMTRAAGNCLGWPKGPRALEGAVSLGLLPVDAQRVAANDQDMDPNQYHAKLRSDRLEGALEMFGGPIAPSFAVTLKTRRDLDEQVVGVKLREAPWADPTLHIDVCTQWDS